MLAAQHFVGDRLRHLQKLASHAPDVVAKLRRTRGCVAMPKRHLARLARRRQNQHAIVRDLLDTPGAGAESERITLTALENHFFVEFADASALFCSSEKDA